MLRMKWICRRKLREGTDINRLSLEDLSTRIFICSLLLARGTNKQVFPDVWKFLPQINREIGESCRAMVSVQAQAHGILRAGC